MLKPSLPKIPERERAVCLFLLSLFQLEGKPVNEIATEGQITIFHALIFRPSKHIQILAATQYGKSLFVALACIIISCVQGELVPVVAPKKEQAKKIMRYYIEHLADNVLFYSQLEKNSRLERLRMEESKERIVLRNSGGIFALSVEAGNASKGVESAMGEGGRIVIQDESGLIPDEHESTIYRMLAGKGANTCYIKIGNPFYCNHFKKSWYDPDYYKIFIDSNRALKEGRYLKDFLDKALKKPLASILYLCEFPEEDEMDSKGYRKLIKSDEYAIIYAKEKPQLKKGWKKLGVDIARGGNWNAYVVRDNKGAYIYHKDKCRDLMATAANIIKVAKDEKISWDDVFIDDTGMGGGVVDRLFELGHYVNACQEGSKATGPNADRFANAKAEANFACKDWLLIEGGRIYGQEFSEIEEIKWKLTSMGDGKIRMESKDDMRKRGIVSPDFWDALTLTFYDKTVKRPSIVSL